MGLPSKVNTIKVTPVDINQFKAEGGDEMSQQSVLTQVHKLTGKLSTQEKLTLIQGLQSAQIPTTPQAPLVVKPNEINTQVKYVRLETPHLPVFFWGEER